MGAVSGLGIGDSWAGPSEFRYLKSVGSAMM